MSRRYLAIIAGIGAALVFVALMAVLWNSSKIGALNDLSALPFRGDDLWYRDIGGRKVPEIQDQDLFYHNIGPSIAEVKKADIVILGPSFVLYALDAEQLKAFSAKYGVKIYDMAFLGIRSGEFSRRIIEKWGIRPKLWIINVDDQIEPFFTTSLDMWWFRSSSFPIPSASYGRVRAWLNVFRRNMRWRVEDLLAASPDASFYRRVDNGTMYLDGNHRYSATDNPVIVLSRDQDCHASPSTIDVGRKYLADIGGHTIFTLMPHTQYCPQQARELAEALGVEAILSPSWRYTSVDGGGHLDHHGAAAFTEYFLSALERSRAFREIAKPL